MCFDLEYFYAWKERKFQNYMQDLNIAKPDVDIHISKEQTHKTRTH